MTKPGDGISIAGNAFFSSGDLTGKLTEGALFVSGNFEVAPSSTPTFVSTGNHTLVLDGRDSLFVQQVKLGTPAPGMQQLRRVHVSGTSEVVFHDVLITDTLSTDQFTTPSGRVSMLGTTAVTGVVDLQGPYTLGGVGTLKVQGDFLAAAPSSVSLAELVLGASSGTTLVSGAFFPARLVLAGTVGAPQTLAPALVYQNVEVRGDALIGYQGGGMPATVAGDLMILGSAARFDVNLASLSVNGSLTVAAGGALVMRSSIDAVTVGRQASFVDASTDSSLSGGTLRLRGDLTVTGGPGSFAASGSHRTELAGAIDQKVTFSAGGPSAQRIWNLALNNSGFVRFTGIYVGGTVSMSDAGGAIDFSGFNEIAGLFGVINNKPLTGSGTLRVDGPLQTSGGVDLRIARLELGDPGGTLGVTGPFSPDTVVFRGSGAMIQMGLDYQTVIVTGQAAFESKGTKTTIARDLLIEDAESKSPGSAQLALNGASDVTVAGNLVVGVNGRLVETNQSDRLTVDGDVRFDGDVPTGSLTAGQLVAKRDVFVSAAGRLVADPGHRLQLAGTAPQKIIFENPRDPRDGGQGLGTVQLSNRSNPGALFATGAFLQGDLILDSDTHLAVEKDVRVYVAGVLTDSSGTTIDIPNTPTSELSVLNITLRQYTPLGKPVTDRQGLP
jgi:hypothetical protein